MRNPRVYARHQDPTRSSINGALRQYERAALLGCPFGRNMFRSIRGQLLRNGKKKKKNGGMTGDMVEPLAYRSLGRRRGRDPQQHSTPSSPSFDLYSLLSS